MKQKIVVKLFLPKVFAATKATTEYLCGEIKCELNHDNVCRQIFIFVTSIHTDRVTSDTTSSGQIIGEISTNHRRPEQTEAIGHDYVWLEYADETTESVRLKTIHLPISASNDADGPFKIQIILYEPKTFIKLCKSDDEQHSDDSKSIVDPIAHLVELLRQREQTIESARPRCQPLRGFLCSLLMIVNRMPLQRILRNRESAFLRHFSIWLESIGYFTFKSGRAWTIVFDVLSGMLVMLVLMRISDPGEYLLKCTELIVRQLQQLLESLKGSPVGFKLNIELNNFFLNCFRYHVDLWSLFLVIIAPTIKYLFAPLAIFGCMGLSFQLAMLSDLLSIITLHAHCIYIYAAILYRVEVVGLLALWRVVSGRRKNILKDRIESYEYTNSQLYLSAMFFTALLFLLPTFLAYYVVFASLRFGFYCITYTLMQIQRKLLTFPIYDAVKWCFGRYAIADDIEITILSRLDEHRRVHNSHSVIVYAIKPAKCPFPDWIERRSDNKMSNNDRQPLTIKQFFMALIKGEAMGFMQPKQMPI